MKGDQMGIRPAYPTPRDCRSQTRRGLAEEKNRLSLSALAHAPPGPAIAVGEVAVPWSSHSRAHGPTGPRSGYWFDHPNGLRGCPVIRYSRRLRQRLSALRRLRTFSAFKISVLVTEAIQLSHDPTACSGPWFAYAVLRLAAVYLPVRRSASTS